MIDICHIAAGNIAELEVMNRATVATAVADLGDAQQTRLIVTNQSNQAIYDSLKTNSTEGKLVLFPEIVEALAGNDVFSWNYQDGAMQSHAAVPILSYGTLVGCVYMMEYDTTQGALIASLQGNILSITLILEIAVILFSLVFSNAYSSRLRKILSSIRTVRDGDYSHKVELRGHDELNILGNQFNDLISRLQISENKRNQFVSDASHELKTPLASIKLLSDSILQNNMDPETVKEFVGDIGNEADRLNRMSQKLLSLSRIDNQEARDCEAVYIAPTIERVVRMLSAAVQKNHITVHLELANDSPILIPEDYLYQILFNLIENGIKYNVENGHLFIFLDRQSNNAVIRIQDTGVGIPEECLDHIFERFYRVDKARSRSTGGSGLGLSIVCNIVKRNHGSIQVESTLGKGTAFTLTFPVHDIQEDTQ